jgi:serine/threonine protein phosphatase PrpC
MKPIRDITPLKKKYNQIKKTKSNNNITKKKLPNNKSIKIEGDLISSNIFPKRARTPLNNLTKKNISNKSSLNKLINNNINSISVNNSIKLNNSKFSPLQKSNNINNKNKYMLGFNKTLPKKNIISKKDNTPISKSSLSKSNNFTNFNKPKLVKFNRSKTPNLKSNLDLSKNNSKINFGKNKLKQNKPLRNKSPILSIRQNNKIKNFFPKFNNNNVFKPKNIFSNQKNNKNKNKVITINMNINQNFLSTSLKHNNINEGNIDKNSAKTEQTNTINNNFINHSTNNLNFNVYKTFNEITKIESNDSIIINAMKNNYTNSNEITPVEKENNFGEKNNKTIRKKILCMHEFSKTGYAGEDEKKINQDNYFVFRNFVNNVNYIFMAVCDGHGAVGQEISSFLKENLPIDLNHALRDLNLNILKDDISQIITDIFIKENTKLISNEMINSMLSGSTCVSAIYTPEKLITANVGDSRIILGKFFSENNTWQSLDLTIDHKPSLPQEEKRIIEKGGRIEPMKDEENNFIGPPRVWLKTQDYPGLAMSRSFGDRVAHSVGVSEEPEIKEYFYQKEDKFFVVASDGLFEFIPSQDIINIIKDYYLSRDIVGCCEYLYELSRERWMKEEEVVDDITMILVFLEDE